MSHTAHKTKKRMQEHFEAEEDVVEKAKQLAQLISQSKHVVFFTGAGISVSAGIPSYRGPEGVWTLRAQGKKRTKPTTPIAKALPTPTHMAIKQLIDKKLAHFVISQNVDGLHVKSGVSPKHIAELHGNTNLERCNKCQASYYRDFRVRSAQKVHDHKTGRKCACGGDLRDSIINFNENLDEDVLELATAHAWEADLMISLGSSLTVSPANSLVGLVAERQKHVAIVNLQITDYDKYATVHCHTKVDEFMKLVCQFLSVDIPEWRLKRRVQVHVKKDGTTTISGQHVVAAPFSFLKSVKINGSSIGSEPFRFKGKIGSSVKAQLDFFGHYLEPSLTLTLPIQPGRSTFNLSYNYFKKSWEIS